MMSKANLSMCWMSPAEQQRLPHRYAHMHARMHCMHALHACMHACMHAYGHPRPQLGFAYGGYGIILSAGLLDRIPAEDWEDCGRRAVCGPSDFRVGTCIRTLAAIGTSHLPGQEPGQLMGTRMNKLRLEPVIASRLEQTASPSERAGFVATLAGLFGEQSADREKENLIMAALQDTHGSPVGPCWPWSVHPVKDLRIANAIARAIDAHHVAVAKACGSLSTWERAGPKAFAQLKDMPSATQYVAFNLLQEVQKHSWSDFLRTHPNSSMPHFWNATAPESPVGEPNRSHSG